MCTLAGPFTERRYAMNALDIKLKIKAILYDRFGIDTSAVDDRTKLQDLGVDSLHLADVMLDLETELGIVIDNLSFVPETTFGDLAVSIFREMEKRA